MDFRKEIIDFIEKKKETELCDFKVEFYSAIKYGDLIKDILAFANNMRDENKYIIFGVDDKGEVVGIDKSPLPEIATVNQLLNEYAESFIDTRIERFRYYDTGKEIAAIVILQSNRDRPYMLKKNYHKNNYKLNNGACFVRKGTTNAVAIRDDFNKMYGISKGSQELTKEVVQKETKLEYDFHRYINREYDLKENPELIRKHFEFLIANPEKSKEIPENTACIVSVRSLKLLITLIENTIQGFNMLLLFLPILVTANLLLL